MKKRSLICGITAVMLMFSILAFGCGNSKTDKEPDAMKIDRQFDSADVTYTAEEISADRHLYFLGQTKPEYVVAKFSDDYTSVEIFNNTSESDGVMGDLVNVTNTGAEAFFSQPTLTSVTIKSGVKSIGDRAFAMCQNLKSVTIPSSVTSIGSGAFAQCSSLTSIVIPASEVEMGDSVFDGCTMLETVTLPNKVYANILEDGKIITTKVYKIPGYLFKDCVSLKSITLPDNITEIDGGAFLNCSSLTSIEIPNGVKKIFENTFKGCSSLRSVTLPVGDLSSNKDEDHYTEVYGCIFSGCTALESVTIPNTVTSISYKAFENCKSLKTIYGSSGSFAETWAKENGYQFSVK